MGHYLGVDFQGKGQGIAARLGIDPGRCTGPDGVQEGENFQTKGFSGLDFGLAEAQARAGG
jgi:hypothetical protein